MERNLREEKYRLSFEVHEGQWRRRARVLGTFSRQVAQASNLVWQPLAQETGIYETLSATVPVA
jgi:hypothetical protein